MKHTLLFMLLFSSMASAETVVLFDDGSTLTLNENESVYVSEFPVYKAVGRLSTNLKIERMQPTEKRDYVAPPPPPPVLCVDTLTFGGSCIETEDDEDTKEDDFTFGRQF